MLETLRGVYFRRVKMVFRTELYGRKKIPAINGFALPVLTYGVGVIIRGPAAARLAHQKTSFYVRCPPSCGGR